MHDIWDNSGERSDSSALIWERLLLMLADEAIYWRRGEPDIDLPAHVLIERGYNEGDVHDQALHTILLAFCAQSGTLLSEAAVQILSARRDLDDARREAVATWQAWCVMRSDVTITQLRNDLVQRLWEAHYKAAGFTLRHVADEVFRTHLSGCDLAH